LSYFIPIKIKSANQKSRLRKVKITFLKFVLVFITDEMPEKTT
jgi:hypothetical protein